jgi:hypothetical protein
LSVVVPSNNFIVLAMKKYSLFFPLLISLWFLGCKKENEKNPNQLTGLGLWLSTLNIDGFNAEDLRIFNDVQGIDYHYGIIANSNSGDLFSFYGSHPYFSGLYPEITTINLNGTSFIQDPEHPIMLNPSFDATTLEQFFGDQLDIEITLDNFTWSFQRYSPVIMQANKISSNSWIDRSGSSLTWEVDLNSPSDKVVVMYEKYDLNFSLYDSNMLVVDNTGSFNLNQILDSECEELSISILHGTTCSFNHKGKKYLFSIYSIDHHWYVVID